MLKFKQNKDGSWQPYNSADKPLVVEKTDENSIIEENDDKPVADLSTDKQPDEKPSKTPSNKTRLNG